MKEVASLCHLLILTIALLLVVVTTQAFDDVKEVPAAFPKAISKLSILISETPPIAENVIFCGPSIILTELSLDVNPLKNKLPVLPLSDVLPIQEKTQNGPAANKIPSNIEKSKSILYILRCY